MNTQHFENVGKLLLSSDKIVHSLLGVANNIYSDNQELNCIKDDLVVNGY